MQHRYISGLFVISAWVLQASPARAQSTVRVGPTLGGTTAWLHFPEHSLPNFETGVRWGLAAGLVGEYSRQRLGLQVGVVYTQAGGSFQHDFGGGSAYSWPIRRTLHLNYVTLPLLVRVGVRPTGQGFYVAAGPYVGRLLGGTAHYEEEGPSHQDYSGRVLVADYSLSSNSDFYTRRWDVGAQVGVGYQQQRLQVQVLYRWGVRNQALDTADPSGNLPGTPFYLRSLSGSATYLWALPKR